MLVIKIVNADGTFSVFSPAPHQQQAGETQAAFYARMGAAQVGAGQTVAIVDDSTLVAPPPTKAALLSYATGKRDRIAAGGLSIVVSGIAVPISADTSTDGKVNLLGLQALAATGAPITWVQSSGPVALTAAQLAAVAQGVGVFVATCWAVYGQLAAAIAAGTVTTTAQIDTPPAPIPAWPINS